VKGRPCPASPADVVLDAALGLARRHRSALRPRVRLRRAPRAPVFALDAVIALAAVVDALLVRGHRIEVESRFAAIGSVGRANPVAIHVRNRSGRTLRGVVSDDPIADATESGLPGVLVLPPHGTTVVATSSPRRGAVRASSGAVTVRYTAPLGLVARQERAELGGRFDVYPDVHAARALELLRRQGRQDARMGSLRVRGGDTEFERLRPTSAATRSATSTGAPRPRDDMTTRQYQAESNQNVVFADRRRSLDARRERRPHGVDQALNASLLAPTSPFAGATSGPLGLRRPTADVPPPVAGAPARKS